MILRLRDGLFSRLVRIAGTGENIIIGRIKEDVFFLDE